MKTIYAFTFKDNNYPSYQFGNNLRLLAYMLYESIYNYYGDNNIPLDINDDIKYNKLNGDYRANNYKFDSEIYDDGEYFDYEPFLVGGSSFALTISDESFGIDIIRKLLDENLRLLGLDYEVSIHMVQYEAFDESDETNRELAVKNVFEKLECKPKKNGFLDMFIKYGKQNRRSSQRR